MSAITSAFLFARSALGLLLGFYVRRAFFAALAFLDAGLRLVGVASVSFVSNDSIVLVLIVFS